MTNGPSESTEKFKTKTNYLDVRMTFDKRR